MAWPSVVEHAELLALMTELPEASRQGSAQQVTASGDAERSVRNARKMETLGRLTAGVAHDFNNLLQVISGYADIVQTIVDAGSMDRARLGRASEAIRAATDQATSLTQKLLDFSGDEGSSGGPVNLNSVVKGLGSVAGRALGDGIELQTVLSSDLWEARVDPTQAGMALLALLINAGDAMPAGGTVTIRTENVAWDDRDAALIEGIQPGRYVALSVSDTGSGMSPEVLGRATEPFFTTREADRAGGLGLAQVEAFAKRSGGAVRIRSQVGQGTVVRLLFPAMAVSEEQP